MSAVLSPTLQRQAPSASPAVAPVSFRGAASESDRVQCASLHVSSPHDAAEREASDVARRVVHMPSPAATSPQAASPAGRVSLSRTDSPRLLSRASVLHAGATLIQREGAGHAAVDGQTSARIQASRGGGQPLSAPLRRFMEPRFGADFSRVRIHTDGQAQQLSQRLSAKAFTTGRDIYFNAGQYAPETTEGRELIAHELAHTIQQGESPRSVQRSDLSPSSTGPTPAEQLSPARGNVVHRLGLSDILDGLAELAANVPGYTLLTLIIGRNPINMRVVERNVVNILRAFIGLIPGGELMFQVLQRQGIVTRVADWVGQQTAALGLNFQTIRDAFNRFTDSLSWTDIFSPGDVWRRARDIFTPLIARITNFVSQLITQAITWLKETFMTPLSEFCRQIPGYGLVTVLLGRDPFTGAAVPRTAMNVVRAFAEFIPGGTEKVDQLVQSGALDRAYAWFQQETGSRNLTWNRVAGTFTAAWASLQLSDVLHPIETIGRIVGQFRPLMSDLVGFAGAALMKLLELIYEAAMGAGGRRILGILTRVRGTFVTIIQNPVGFLRNLLGAVGQGVRQFMTRILVHLRDGVIAWLTGPVARAGIQMPERWDLQGIIWFVLQVLGLSWQRVRQKLVRLIGEPAMAAMERGLQFIRDVRDRGLVATLRERVSEFFGNLRESALGAIRGFIQQRLVQAGIQQLLSLLSPVGAVIQAIIKTYTTIQFFIQRINQIMDLVESILDSVSAIASGAIGAAANFVERTMARTIPVILDFLARFIGLGDVGAQVQTTIRNLQGGVDRMLDRAVDWIRRQAGTLASRLLGGDPSAPSGDRVRSGLREAVPLVNRYAGRPVGAVVLRPLLMPIKVRHRLSRLDVVPRGPVWGVVAAASPEVIEPTTARVDTASGAGIAGLRTQIRYNSGTLAGTGNTVGTEMIADPLGPDHPMGQEPAGSNIWSALLVTDPGQTNDRKYIRGHLLNHQVGGSGAAQNLFPITAAANDQHESQFESRIKQWVNVERKWVRYQVRVSNINVVINAGRRISTNKIDADFVCSAHVYDPTRPLDASNRLNAIQATITSRYRGTSEATAASGPARGAETAVASRPEDRAATVALPAGHEYRLDNAIFGSIRRARDRAVGVSRISEALQDVSQIGPGTASTIMKAYRLSFPSGGADLASQLTTDERSNLTRANGRASLIASTLDALT